MDRSAVTGVRRAPVQDAAVSSQSRSFEPAQAIAGGIAVVLAGLRGLVVGAPTLEWLLLVPFWFSATPVLAWAGGLGVSYWSKADHDFLAIDGEARPLLAKAVLLLEMVASVGFAVALFAVRVGTGGG